MGHLAVLLGRAAPGADEERFFDRRRRMMMWMLAGVWFLGATTTLVAGYWDVAIALSLPGLIAVRMAMLEVVASSDGLVVMTFFRRHHLPWGNISHFELKRFGLREAAVPSVVTADSRRLALHGLDSPLSGAGTRSPEWEPTLRRLSERLNNARRGGSWG